MSTSCATEHLKLQFSKFKMADGRYLERFKNRRTSATDRPILMEFGRMTQIWSLERIRWNWIFENPRWRRPPFWKTVKSWYLRNRL